jgi:two-component system chemotaxis sensor kinase CheA
MTVSTPTDIFLVEAQELLEQLEQTLLDLEGAPADRDLIDSAFRALHTIKGSGSMFGFAEVASFTHHVESAFDHVRQGKAIASAALIALALRAADHIRGLINAPGGADDAVAASILTELRALSGNDAEAPPRTHAQPQEARPATWHIRMRLPLDAIAMGTNPLLLLDELRELGEATLVCHDADVPAIEALDPGACHLWWTIALATSVPRSAIEDVFMFVIDDMDLRIERTDTQGDTQIDKQAVALVPDTEGTVFRPEAAAPAAQHMAISAAAQAPTAPQSSAASQGGAEARPNKVADSVRVPAERLDDLMERVGELVIAQSRLSQVANAGTDTQLKTIAEDMERLVLELRDTTMGVRTVPIAQLFSRFRRLIHDLSSQLGKEIALVTVGEETELDKTLIEKLSDPLIHLLRNAIDHGLETPQGRQDAGKPPCGLIKLTARHAGSEVLITISDDGAGLDRGRIRARAEERGLLAEGAPRTDDELYKLIFEPGFSTASEVTSLSGRGVGMDVVKRALESLRGRIDIASTPGAGTEITLHLPLTLAIIDGLLVRIGSGRYVVPLSSVEECVELTPEQDGRSRGRSFLSIRDDLVPFLRLRELFAVGGPPDRYQKVVVVSCNKHRVGLVVDQVIGNYQTVIKSLSRLHADAPMFSGATILGDGTVALIMDVAQLVAFGEVRDEQLRDAG